jgi:hypothetical protein
MNPQAPPPIEDSKPTMREGASYHWAKAAQDMIEQVHVDVFKTCLTCINFREKSGELCTRFGGRPPARVIAYGCAEYFHNDEVPF